MSKLFSISHSPHFQMGFLLQIPMVLYHHILNVWKPITGLLSLFAIRPHPYLIEKLHITQISQLVTSCKNCIILLDCVCQMGVNTLNYEIRNKVCRDLGWLDDCGTHGRLVPQKAFIIHFCFAFPYYNSLKIKNTYLPTLRKRVVMRS